MQSSAVLLLACERVIPPFDYALFADTRWEPQSVYATITRLRTRAARAGIPVCTVSAGDIRTDALNPNHRYASMPLHVRRRDGGKGMARRQCTAQYKVAPLKRAARDLLGYPHPAQVPAGVYAEQAIGISTDEVHRAKDADVRYLRNTFPLIELGWDRDDCHRYLTNSGYENTIKSACVGCPFAGNSRWRWIRDHDPDASQAVDFDKAIRHGHPHAIDHDKPLYGEYFLHPSCQPLDQVNLDPPAAGHEPSQEEFDPDGCSPWACRSGTRVDPPMSGDDPMTAPAADMPLAA